MAATITREQLNKLLEGIATSHWQVHTYGWGDVPDLLAREDVIYPFMMVTPQASVYGENTINHTYTISIADRVLKDKENEVAVDSDTHQILMDVVTQLDNLLYDDVDLIKGITVTPFFDNFRHEVTGHFANVTVQVMYNYDACAIPSDNVVLPLPPPSDCADASYRVQYENGTLIEQGTIPSGGSKTIEVPDIVPCADATWELRDSAGVLIDSGSIASGGSATITAPDGVVTITDSAAATLYVVNVKSDGTATQVIADSVVTLNNSAAGLISTTSVKAEDAATIVAPDANVSLNGFAYPPLLSGSSTNLGIENTLGSAVGSFSIITDTWVIGDSTVNVNKSDGVLISARVVRAEETENYNVADSVIENSDSSYTANVKATDGLVLPDQQIDVNTVNEGSIPSVGGIDINITDGVNPVTPNSVGIVGRTVTVEVPSGGGVVMDVDFSADKLTAAPFEDIQFTDLSDENPTHWSWRFGDGSSSQVQNPIKQYTSAGFYNITLLAGRVGAGGVDIKNSYIEIAGDPIYLAFIAAFNTATGSTIGATQDAAVLGLVSRLRGVGTTNGSDLLTSGKISALYPYVPVNDTTANSAGMALDLLLNFNGSFVNFVSGDFQPNGITGGTSKYFNTNYNPVTQSDSITDFSFGFDAATSTTSLVNPMGVRNGNDSYTASVYASGNFITGIAETANLSRFARANMPANLNSVNVLSTTKKVFNAGVEIDSVTRTGTSFFNGNFFCHASNSIGTAGGFDNRRFRGFYIGKGLTNNEQADLYEAWNWFQQNVITGGR
jgi:PKD repeat protein